MDSTVSDSTVFLGSYLGVIVVIFFIVLAILWFILPFIIYSIKNRSQELVALNTSILSELKKLNKGVDSIGSEAPTLSKSKCPKCGMENSIDVLKCVKCGYELPIVR